MAWQILMTDISNGWGLGVVTIASNGLREIIISTAVLNTHRRQRSDYYIIYKDNVYYHSHCAVIIFIFCGVASHPIVANHPIVHF